MRQPTKEDLTKNVRVEISNIDEMIAPKEYLFDKEDIEDIIEKYDR